MLLATTMQRTGRVDSVTRMHSEESYGLLAPPNMHASSAGGMRSSVCGAGAVGGADHGGLSQLFTPFAAQTTTDWPNQLVHTGGCRQQPLQEQEYIGHSSSFEQQLHVSGTALQEVTTPAFLLMSSAGLHRHSASFFSTSMPVVSRQEVGDDSFRHMSLHAAAHSADHHYRFKQYLQFSQVHAGEDGEMTIRSTQQIPSPIRTNLSPWQGDETAAFMDICSKILFDASTTTSWEDVARKLQAMGYQRSAQQCKDKYENTPMQKRCNKRKNCDSSERREVAGSHELIPSDQIGDCSNININEEENVDDALELQHQLHRADNIIGSDHAETNQILMKKRRITYNNGNSSNNSSLRPPSKRFFERLTREIMEKQESLHKSFLETIETNDRERAVREDGYRKKEAARKDREQEIRAQEVSLAASRSAALIAFLNKVTGQTLIRDAGMAAPASYHAHLLHHEQAQLQLDAKDMDNFNFNTKRWPKVEVHALIRLRSGMEPRFREAGPKAHLWQEISTSMACLGFIRSPKRCKEKWENINKYFKKTKDSSKKRPENAKTCPYFHQLDTLYQRGILASSSTSIKTPTAGKSTSDSHLDYSGEEEDCGASKREHNAAESAMANTTQSAVFVGADYSSSSPLVGAGTSVVPLSNQMQNFLHQYQVHSHSHEIGQAHTMSNNIIQSFKKSVQVEMFVKDVVELQQQQHQKLVDEYERMEQAHDMI